MSESNRHAFLIIKQPKQCPTRIKGLSYIKELDLCYEPAEADFKCKP